MNSQVNQLDCLVQGVAIELEMHGVKVVNRLDNIFKYNRNRKCLAEITQVQTIFVLRVKNAFLNQLFLGDLQQPAQLRCQGGIIHLRQDTLMGFNEFTTW